LANVASVHSSQSSSMESKESSSTLRGLDEEVFVMSSCSNSMESYSLSLTILFVEEGSFDFLAFLDSLPEHIVDNLSRGTSGVADVMSDAPNHLVRAPQRYFMVEEEEDETQVEVVTQKSQRVQVEKKKYPSITLPQYSWMDGEVGTFFSRYNDRSDIESMLSWLTLCPIKEDNICLITLRMCSTNANPPFSRFCILK